MFRNSIIFLTAAILGAITLLILAISIHTSFIKLPPEQFWLVETPIAHRGLHNNDCGITENSPSAFMQAIKYQTPIELDVHLLKDNQVVVFHDYTLTRLTGENTDIRTITSQEIRRFQLPNKETIPLLKDVLNLVKGEVPILIEIKTDSGSPIGPLEKELVSTLREYEGKYAIQAFNPYSLAEIRKLDPTITRIQLSGSFSDEEDMPQWQKIALSNLLMNPVSQPHAINYEKEALPNPMVSLYQLFNMPVLVWTVDNETQALDAQKNHFNILFDDYHLLKQCY